MKAMVVYDSAYGTTKQVAEAFGDTLRREGDVKVVRAGEVRPESGILPSCLSS